MVVVEARLVQLDDEWGLPVARVEVDFRPTTNVIRGQGDAAFRNHLAGAEFNRRYMSSPVARRLMMNRKPPSGTPS